MSFTRKFYTSDTHFNHRNILSLCSRPFADIVEHDEALIQRWNSVVGVDDIVYHLGDFGFRLSEDEARIRSIFSRLQGRKYLIIGNHDVRKDGSLHPVLADLDWSAPPTHMMQTTDCGKRLVLCHYALREWQGTRKGSYHFYGHSHGNLPGVGRSRDVGVDLADVQFQPRTFQELTRGME